MHWQCPAQDPQRASRVTALVLACVRLQVELCQAKTQSEIGSAGSPRPLRPMPLGQLSLPPLHLASGLSGWLRWCSLWSPPQNQDWTSTALGKVASHIYTRKNPSHLHIISKSKDPAPGGCQRLWVRWSQKELTQLPVQPRIRLRR